MPCRSWEVRLERELKAKTGVRVQPETKGQYETSGPMQQAEAKLEPGVNHRPPTERGEATVRKNSLAATCCEGCHKVSDR